MTTPNLQNIPIRTAAGRRVREAFLGGESALERGTRIHSQIEAYLRGYQRDALESLHEQWLAPWPALRWLHGRGYGKAEAQRVAEAKAAAEHEARLAERLSRRVAAVAVIPFPLPTAEDLAAKQWARALLSVQPGGMSRERFEEWRER